MKERPLGRLVVCLLGLVILPPLCWPFSGLARLGYCTLVSAFLAATARTRAVRWITSAGAFGMAILFLMDVPETLPLRAPLRGARFVNAPVTEVL